MKHSTEIEKKVNEWADLQRSQHLLTNLVQLVLGLRIEVYRADGTTQWYTAVTTGYNATAHEYTLTDDTVLEEHFEDPRLTQMTVMGGRSVLESLLRGDNVVPRRSRSSVANANQVHILQGFMSCTTQWSLSEIFDSYIVPNELFMLAIFNSKSKCFGKLGNFTT